MARRAAYTKVARRNFTQPAHVAGMGDKVLRGFQCLNKDCTATIFKLENEIGADFEIACDVCGFIHQAGEVTKLYDYDLVDERNGTVVETGPFEILHDDYVREAARYKYCVLCGALKPINLFDRHSARKSGRQSECNLCKQSYNSIKNQTRLVEQHREAAQKRRLYVQFDSGKLDIDAIYRRYDCKCFKCGKELSGDLVADGQAKLGNLDHTLSAYFLWPMTTDNATLLCREHNGEKAERWPAAYYNDAELRRLSALTGIDYRLMAGPPQFNPEALKSLSQAAFIERLFEKFAAYPAELLRLRNRVLTATGFDFLAVPAKISSQWVKMADELRAAKPAEKARTDDA